MRCRWCRGELVEVDNPMRREVRHRRGEETLCPGPPAEGDLVAEITAVDTFSAELRALTPALDIVADVRCDLTGLIVSQCAHCRPAPPVPDDLAELRARLYRRRGWFPSRYAGECHGCGDPFPPDTAVHRTPGDAGGFIAECCADEGGEGGG